MSTPELTAFVVEWLDHEGVAFEKDVIRKHDLTAAIRSAAAKLARGHGNAAGAHGLFVRRAEEDDE